jgi:hypothetical protein
MKPEPAPATVRRHIAECEQTVARQKELIARLESEGHPTEGARILLGLLEDALRNAKQVFALMESRSQQP